MASSPSSTGPAVHCSKEFPPLRPSTAGQQTTPLPSTSSEGQARKPKGQKSYLTLPAAALQPEPPKVAIPRNTTRQPSSSSSSSYSNSITSPRSTTSSTSSTSTATTISTTARTPQQQRHPPRSKQQLRLSPPCSECAQHDHHVNRCFYAHRSNLERYLKIHPEQRQMWERRVAQHRERKRAVKEGKGGGKGEKVGGVAGVRGSAFAVLGAEVGDF